MMNRLAIAHAMLRLAAQAANRTLINQYGQQYATPSATPEMKAKIKNNIYNDRELWNYIRSVLRNKVRTRIPNTPDAQIEDIVSTGILNFLRAQGIEKSLDTFSTRPGGHSYLSWLFQLAWWYTQKQMGKFVKEYKTGVTSEKPSGTVSPYTSLPLDGPINPRSQFQSLPKPAPERHEYWGKPDSTIEYMDLLDKVNERLEDIKSGTMSHSPEAAKELAGLQEMRQELIARLEQIEKDGNKWYGTEPAPAGYETRLERTLSEIGNHQTTDSQKVDHTLRAIGQQYDGLPQYIESILDDRGAVTGKNVANLKPHSDPKRWYHPSPLFAEMGKLETDPAVRQKIRQAVIGAVVDAHQALNNKEIHRKKLLDGDFKTRSFIGQTLKEWLPILIKDHMSELGLPQEVQDKATNYITNYNLQNLLRMINDGDEMKRLYTYDRLRQEAGVQDWGQLTPEQSQAITENAYTMMNYSDDNRPYARNPKMLSTTSSQGKLGFDPNAMRQYMMSELQGIGQLRHRPLMPEEASFFNVRQKRNQDDFRLMPDPVTAAGKDLAQRMAYKIVCNEMTRQALTAASKLEEMGHLRQADSIDQMVRCAARVWGD